ncbi:MAG: DUF6266 family protein [Bacteroidota bacterium]
MARINQGFLGNASGKLGNVVFARWRQLNTARQYQPDIQDANSPAQQKQRSRMVALLQFLKPINKSFLQLYNSPLAKNSTPWAMAIKANMPRVSPEGIILLQDLQLGDPNLSNVELQNIIYNPFIDQVSFSYAPAQNLSSQGGYPYIASSVLGKYSLDSFSNDFDVRHLLCTLPDGRFFCSIYDENYEYVFDNCWAGGMFWMIYFNTYNIDKVFNPNDNLSLPTYFVPESILESFNNSIKDNPVPPVSIAQSYELRSGSWFLLLKIDFTKTTLTTPADHSLLFWGVSLQGDMHEQSDVYEWDLANENFEIEIGPEGINGSVIILYSVYKKSGEQIARFNRIYLPTGTDNKLYPYFEQLFLCDYSHPASFVLSGDNCGFCGNIDNLFSDFIQLWEQGIIHEGHGPAPIIEQKLAIGTSVNGSVVVTGQSHASGSDYYFAKDKKAYLEVVPESGYEFSLWTGPDNADVTKLDETHFEIVMSKDRGLTATFIHA